MIFGVCLFLLAPISIYALPSSNYAASSVLSSGRWVRIKVSSRGMHIISDAELRKLGFNDPSKVQVFGTGGRHVGNAFNSSTKFDLPWVPSVHTDKGVVFFATDQHTWKEGLTSLRPYIHTINPYSDDCYYFITDRETAHQIEPSEGISSKVTSNIVTEFIDRVVHEKELDPMAESGSQVYGEDFRSTPEQSFGLKFPGRVSGTDASVNIRFASKTTNGGSTLVFKANGNQIGTASINSVSAEKFCAISETAKAITDNGESISLSIKYGYNGVLYKARLDYIEGFYTRKLALDNGTLHFYGNYGGGESLSIAGCGPQTVIWDVTDCENIRAVEYSLSGDQARFTVVTKGYREFVAFNPSAVTQSVTAENSIANQDIHGMETPDMVIITMPAYKEGAEKIAALHREMDGMRVHVLEVQPIYNEFSSGRRDVGAFRRMLKMWYDRGESADGHKLQYCLLMGRPTYDNKLVSSRIKNAGYTPLPIYQSYDGYSDEESFSCDDYIGMLQDVEENRFSMTSAKIHIAIGRLPVTSSQEALQMASKIESYAKGAELGTWRNKVMLIADDDDGGAHLKQAEDAYAAAISGGNGNSFLYDRLYLDSYKRVMTSVGATYPQATERMMRNYNDGVLLTGYIGHASETGWGHEHLWEWPSITSMTNKNLTFLYAATCSFANWDRADICGAEELMLNPNSGVIGVVAASRKVFVNSNGYFSKSIFGNFFKYSQDGEARTYGDIYLSTRNEQLSSNSLRYLLMGDPALKMPNPTLNVRVTTINGTELDSGEEWPELGAQSAAVVEGEILRADGNLADDFNGTINLDLYDGERVITTYGQGASGVVMNYNDRDKRLSMATAKVEGGKWKATLMVPPEIQGTYTPAMITAYAWSKDRKEANGKSESFYVYGYAPSGSDDENGPQIEYFYVNTPNFENGGLVNSNPVILARLSDESGINISSTGIGHAMTLTVDDKTVYSDLNAYFTPDPEDSKAGTLAYPITGITAGKHTLTLSVWDNANNVSKSSIDINVGAAVDPVIYGITASTNPTSVDFRIDLDRPNTQMKCEIGIYDLNGRRVWSLEDTLSSDMQSSISTSWNLCDSGGSRVPRGIYIYRVTVETPEGTYSSKSKKIAISAGQ